MRALSSVHHGTMLEQLLGWWPILWTARALVLILLLGASAASFLYFLRFFRWRSLAIMWNARLPKLKKLGGKWAGQEIGLELDEGQEVQVAALERRLDEMGVARAVDREAIEDIVRYLIGKEAQHDFFDPDALPGDTGGAGGAEADR